MLPQQLNPNFTALEKKRFGKGLLLLFISRYKRLTLSLLVPRWTALLQFSSIQERNTFLPYCLHLFLFLCFIVLVFLSISRFVYKRISHLLKFLFLSFPLQKPNTVKSNTHSFILLRCGKSLLIRKSRKAKFFCRMMGVSFLNSDNSWKILGKYVLAKIHSASDTVNKYFSFLLAMWHPFVP